MKHPTLSNIDEVIEAYDVSPSDRWAIVRMARSLHRQSIRWNKLRPKDAARMRCDARDMVTFARHVPA